MDVEDMEQGVLQEIRPKTGKNGNFFALCINGEWFMKFGSIGKLVKGTPVEYNFEEKMVGDKLYRNLSVLKAIEGPMRAEALPEGATPPIPFEKPRFLARTKENGMSSVKSMRRSIAFKGAVDVLQFNLDFAKKYDVADIGLAVKRLTVLFEEILNEVENDGD